MIQPLHNLSTGPSLFESPETTLAAGWNHLEFALKSATWKSEASGWKTIVKIGTLQQVNRVLVGLFGYEGARGGAMAVTPGSYLRALRFEEIRELFAEGQAP